MKKLMKHGMLITGAMLLLAAKPAWGAEDMKHDQAMLCEGCDRYRAHELSVDAFGTGSIGKYTINHLSGSRIRENTEFGVGVGMNYFFTRNLGLGGDVYSENNTGAFIDNASVNLLLRLPLGQSGFAPYVLGGGGYQFDRVDGWLAQFGGGMEYRFTPHVGLFLDARLVLPEQSKYYGVARLGLRFAF
jgi:hypothetical protein